MTIAKASKKLQLPLHVGIIMDGNRRWARGLGLPPLEGHRQGLNNIKIIARQAFRRGVKVITIFAFSTENWRRDKQEVIYLMKLFKIFIKREVGLLAKEGIKIKFLGRLSDFNQEMRLAMKEAEVRTKSGSSGQLNVCLSYGGRDEIIRAVKKVVKTKKSVSEITEELISQSLDSVGIPDPDFIIRTSGEQRLSGFLTWQAVYSELYFAKKHWPAFGIKDLDRALQEYAKRQRRFGGS